MGSNYPGAGITLGPALTFGHIAAATSPASRRAELRNSPDCKTGSADRALRGRRRYRRHGRSRLGGCDERNNINVSKLLDGQIVLVTGAGQGNGRAIAKGIARSGARVVVTDVQLEMAEKTAQQIRSDGGEASAFRST